MNDATDKKVRPRSPEFPFVPLKEAIQRVDQLITANQRHPVRIKNVAPLWSYSSGSSSFLRTVAALRVFGLVDETGSGDDRKIAVSDLGMKVVMDKRPGATEAAIVKAFENCTILNEYRQKWGKKRPSDTVCLSELTLDNGFTDVAARKFISVYDDTVTFVESVETDSGRTTSKTPSDIELPSFDVGMYVQWEQGGALQLEKPTKLVGFSADGKYAFVDGSQAGIPRVELIAADAPLDVETKGKPPRSSAVARIGGANMTEATYPIVEGICTLTYPADLSEKSAKRLKRWLDLMLEDIAEIAELPANGHKKTDQE